jgi:ribosomal-protein-alanine N-acetyltransferase
MINLFALYPEGFYVAEDEGIIVGYIIFRQIGPKGHIIDLAVDKRVRRRGVGSQLLHRAISVFGERGLNGVWLEVRVTNIDSQLFYLRKGFKNLTLVEGYYGNGEDAYILYMPLLS